MRQLYMNKNVSKRDNYMQIKCFKMRQLNANKMFQNERIIYE